MFDLKEYTKYLVISGSHAYGMATETSDLDIRGWCTPPKEYFLSYHLKFEQSEAKYTPVEFPWTLPAGYERYNAIYGYTDVYDTVIYDIRKFAKLAAECNPNVVELLFVDPSDIIATCEYADLLRANANMFLSGRARYTFSGYARAQLKRINTHRRWIAKPPDHKPTRLEFGLPEQLPLPAEQREAAYALIDKQVRLWLLEESEADKTIASAIRDDLVEALAYMGINSDPKLVEYAQEAAARKLGFDGNFIKILQAERKYRTALDEWNNYLNWKSTRNPARSALEEKFGYDTKHASHLVRLMLMCEEILTKGTLTVKDKDRAKHLLEIRAGSMTYDQLIIWTDDIEKRLDDIYIRGDYRKYIPKTPDVNKIDELCMKIIRATWGDNNA